MPLSLASSNVVPETVATREKPRSRPLAGWPDVSVTGCSHAAAVAPGRVQYQLADAGVTRAVYAPGARPVKV